MRRSILATREVLVPVVDSLELAAVDRDVGLGEKAHRAAERNKPGANLADGSAIVPAEIGDRLVIGHQAAGQPHDLDVAPHFALEPATRLNPVQIVVDVKLQEDRRMIRRAAGRHRIDAAESQPSEIEFLNKNVNHANRIILVDPVIQTFRKERGLAAIHPLNKALHPIPRK
jgi:hypothetical protein